MGAINSATLSRQLNTRKSGEPLNPLGGAFEVCFYPNTQELTGCILVCSEKKINRNVIE